VAGRSAKTMIAYIPVPGLNGASVTWKTAGDYTHVGLVYNWQSNEWEIVAKGWSPISIAGRTRTAARKMYAHAPQFAGPSSAVAQLHETTAPIIAEYFGGDHRVRVTAVFLPEHGWQSVNWPAGRSNLRQLAQEGYAGVMIEGRRPGETHARNADFPMTEILKSLNSRKAAV
jgi:hypothetical protein